MKKTLLSLAVLVVAVGCNGTDNTPEPQTSKLHLPTKISADYDGQIALQLGLFDTEENWTYNTDNSLAKKEVLAYNNNTIFLSRTWEFNYQNGKVVNYQYSQKEYNANGTVNETSGNTYTMNVSVDYKPGKITLLRNNTEEVVSWNIDEKGFITDNRQYDSNGNTARVETNELLTVYQYDSKNGMFKNVNNPQWFKAAFLNEFWSVNNLTANDVTIKESGMKIKQGFSYQYNTQEYPVKANITVELQGINVQGTQNIEYLTK